MSAPKKMKPFVGFATVNCYGDVLETAIQRKEAIRKTVDPRWDYSKEARRAKWAAYRKCGFLVVKVQVTEIEE